MKRKLEQISPYLVSLVVIIILKRFNIKDFKMHRLDLIMDSLISVSTTMIGFFITVITLLVTLMDEKVMRYIHGEKATSLLISYFISPIAFSLFIIINCYYLAIVVTEDLILSEVQLCTSVFILTSWVLSILRLTIVMALIIKALAKENNKKTARDNEVKEADPDRAFAQDI